MRLGGKEGRGEYIVVREDEWKIFSSWLLIFLEGDFLKVKKGFVVFGFGSDGAGFR